MDQANKLKKQRPPPVRPQPSPTAVSSLPRLDTKIHPGTSVKSPQSLPNSPSPATGGKRRRSLIQSFRSLGSSSPASPASSSSRVLAVPDIGPALSTPEEHPGDHGGDHGGAVSARREHSKYDFALGALSWDTTSTSQSSTNSIDGKIQWELQSVKGVFKTILEPQILRTKSSYIVVTSDYIIKLKGMADVRALFPALPPGMLPNTAPVMGKGDRTPEVLQVVPVAALISASRAESSRPYFGVELWWKSTRSLASFGACQFFAEDPRLRDLMLDCIHAAVRAKDDDHLAAPRVAYEVEEKIRELCQRYEPDYPDLRPEIFPVGIRLTDKTRWTETESYYFAIGINLCYFAKASRPPDTRKLVLTCTQFGILNLECASGCWAPREDRFELRFRRPFDAKATHLHMSSRFYRQILQSLLKADELLRPCWPSRLRRTQIFRISQLPSPESATTTETSSIELDALYRTHLALCAAYQCRPLAWEIKPDGPFGHALRILPPARSRSRHEPLELLAVFRAVRYNRLIGSISFRGVSLEPLWNKFDSSRPESVAYMSHDERIISSTLCRQVQNASVLSQEIHALALCLPLLRQIDMTGTLGELPETPDNTRPDLGIIFPIFNLLAAGLTACNRVVVRGCCLGPGDVDGLVSSLTNGDVVGNSPLASSNTRGLCALDVSECSLSSEELKDITGALMGQSKSLQLLDISQNTGRVAASTISKLVSSMDKLQSLGVGNAIMGQQPSGLIPRDSLCAMGNLRHINLSGYTICLATERALVEFLAMKTRAQSLSPDGGPRGLERVQLKGCGIDGYQAARILTAASGVDGLHLHLGANPLEHGIEELASVIALCSKGSLALHLDMVEFSRDAGYVRLIQALTVSKRFCWVSLAGTTPSPPPRATCTDAVADALEQLLARNTSIRTLDLSGYAGRLDDGQLGRGFGRALGALARNRTLRSLALRNQNLSTEVAGLGLGMQHNRALRRLDLSGAEITLTALLFLRRALRPNRHLLRMPFGRDQQELLLERALRNVPDHARPAARADLGLELAKQLALVRGILARNRAEAGLTVAGEDDDDDNDDNRYDVYDNDGDDNDKYSNEEEEEEEEEDSVLGNSSRRRVLSSSIKPEAFVSPYRLSDAEEAVASGSSVSISVTT